MTSFPQRNNGSTPMRVRAPKDFWAGLFFVLFGAFFAIYSLEYRIGNIHRLGPGMFPFIVSGILTGLGVLLIFKSLINDGDAVHRFALRSSGISLFAVVLFGALIKPAGLVISTFTLVVLSGIAQPQSRFLHILALGGGIAIFCALLFVGVIGLPIPIWPSW